MIDIQKEIAQALTEYTTEVTEELDRSKEEVAKEAVKRLKRTSPKDTGRYARGWRAKKVGNAWVVHNKTDYQLTHLLEKGHAKRGGGRVSARPHIKPVEQDGIREFIDRAEKVVKG